MKPINTVTLEGVISEHLDIRYFDYEHLRVKLQLETTEEGLKADGSDWVQWHNIEFHNAIAKEAEEQLKKGDRIRIEGRIAYHKELDHEGRKRYITIIHAREFSLLEGVEKAHFEAKEELQAKEINELEWDKFSATSDEDPMA